MPALPGRPWTEDTYNPVVPGSNSDPSTDIDSIIQGSGSSFNASSSLDSVDSNLDFLLHSLSEKASKGDESALEKLFNYYATVKSEKTARDWTSAREDNQYQRLVSDLQKAGISPYILSSAVPGVSSASSSSFSGSQMTSHQSNERTNDTGVARSLIALVGTAMFILATML